MVEIEDKDNLVKVGFYDEDGEVETLLAAPLGENLYRLENSPLSIYGVSRKDVVEAQPDIDDTPFFVRVVHKSGYRTMRLTLEGFSIKDRAAEPILAGILNLGCDYEGIGRWIAVDVPPEVELETVAEYLAHMGFEWEYVNPTYDDLFPASLNDGERTRSSGNAGNKFGEKK